MKDSKTIKKLKILSMLFVIAVFSVCFVSCGNDDKDDITTNESTQSSLTGTANGHEWVDLGLPSGTKWATCNVGASKPEDYGDHFAWGETSKKSTYSWDTYKYGGRYDVKNIGSNIAGTQYDVASVKWGGSWRMPTLAQSKELFNNTTSEWTTQNGVKGRKFTSKKNSMSIFIPAAGGQFSGYSTEGEDGGTWLANVYQENNEAYIFNFTNEGIWWDTYDYRCNGYTVRPVLLMSGNTSGNSSGNNDNSGSGTGTDPGNNNNSGSGTGTVNYTSCPDNNHPHAIDLGLPSGTKWACCNVGATKPEGYGDYYAWGETETKSVYSWDTYKYGRSSKDVDNIGADIAGTKYDVAHVKWGGGWRMPTLEQIKELMANTTHEWTRLNGVAGRLFTGKNGGTVFLPAAGDRWRGEFYGVGHWGIYWSSTPYDENYACYLYFYSDNAYWDYFNYFRNFGVIVRPVR